MLKKSEKKYLEFYDMLLGFYLKKWIVFWYSRNFAAVFFKNTFNFFRKRNYFFHFFVQYFSKTCSDFLEKWFYFFWFLFDIFPENEIIFWIFYASKNTILIIFALFFYGWFIYIDSFCSLSIRKIAIKLSGHR